MIDFTKLTLAQVEKIFVDTGYEVERGYHDFARENDLFRFVGVENGSARYIIGYEDDEEEGKMYASMMFVSIGPSGKLVADYGGCPEYNTFVLEDLTSYIQKY